MAQVLFAYCPQTLYGAGCADPACTLVHDARWCKLCAVICEPASSYDKHLDSTQHKKALERPSWVHCPLCKVSVIDRPEVWDIHIAGRPHRQRALQQHIEPDSRCDFCNIVLDITAWESHMRVQHAAYRVAFVRASQDREGVNVSHAEAGLDFGIVGLAAAKKGVQSDLLVSTDNHVSVTLVSADVVSASGVGPKHPKSTPFRVNVADVHVASGQSVSLPVRFQSERRGRFEAQLAITFHGTSQKPFVMIRRLRIVVGDAADHEALKPVTPYVRNRRVPWRKDLPTVSGERPPSLVAAQYIKKLPNARIPAKLAEALRSGTPEEIETRIWQNYFSGPLRLTTHATFFANLLWIEEDRMVEDLRRYDMAGVSFAKDGRLYSLQVPGLAEKRPSVMIGDVIKVQAADGADERTYEGFVHDVYMGTIRVSFHGSFKGDGRRYNVSFQLNRIPLRRQHQALNSSPPNPQRLLFPIPGHQGLERALEPNEQLITLFNPLIGTNPAQLLAVKSILRLRLKSAPFVLFGPPGTGKTVTDVEAIRQILHKDKDARVLACAPSNSAADIIALRLSTALTPEEMFRCNAASRDPRTVPEALMPYTLHMTGHYGLPPLETLNKYRVVVATCGNASFAYNVGMSRGHFAYIFIDEAGQATEPEVLTAIKTMASDDTRIVLSGDPKQLGPIIRSSIAREHGLAISYMERLMERPVYDAQTGRGLSWVKLLQNYRSHEAILRYPNAKFYDNELKVCGDRGVINSFLGSSQLASPKFPVVFHALAGHNDRELTSPSYFNIDEASEVKAYVQALLADRQHPIQAKDIGVITPYHAQVRKIRKLLRDADIPDVDVGSVEIFQGQERRAVIISTVRSSADLLAYDAKFTLGLRLQSRVASTWPVTRAQALLIVIGDAAILSLDHLWRGFMNHVYLNGGWRGDPPTWDVNAPVRDDANYVDELQEALAAEMSDLEGDANVDSPFQETD
ncbi:P-loop containing nucleoside triphosphate hydrolase protein [Ganoderma leucocontextum]|nr:P-loop containing nucleoside triphosphate hydrolase protein [Ganoderma leucocontextum]